jgi:hypothetical protein
MGATPYVSSHCAGAYNSYRYRGPFANLVHSTLHNLADDGTYVLDQRTRPRILNSRHIAVDMYRE